jgi:hypothetical protein
MARIHIANIVADTGPLNKVVRAVHSDGSMTAKGLKQAARAYQFYLKQRYLTYSQGGGDWKKLKPSYAKQKGNNIILILNGDLYNGIKIKKSRSAKNPGYNVGYVTGEGHEASGMTVRALANIHQNIGIVREDGVARRKIIVLPNSATRRAMTGYIQTGVNKDIRRANSGS